MILDEVLFLEEEVLVHLCQDLSCVVRVIYIDHTYCHFLPILRDLVLNWLLLRLRWVVVAFGIRLLLLRLRLRLLLIEIIILLWTLIVLLLLWSLMVTLLRWSLVIVLLLWLLLLLLIAISTLISSLIKPTIIIHADP